MSFPRPLAFLFQTLALIACGSPSASSGPDAGHDGAPDSSLDRDGSGVCPTPASITQNAACSTPTSLSCPSLIAQSCCGTATYWACTCESGAWLCSTTCFAACDASAPPADASSHDAQPDDAAAPDAAADH